MLTKSSSQSKFINRVKMLQIIDNSMCKPIQMITKLCHDSEIYDISTITIIYCITRKCHAKTKSTRLLLFMEYAKNKFIDINKMGTIDNIILSEDDVSKLFVANYSILDLYTRFPLGIEEFTILNNIGKAELFTVIDNISILLLLYVGLKENNNLSIFNKILNIKRIDKQYAYDHINRYLD